MSKSIGPLKVWNASHFFYYYYGTMLMMVYPTAATRVSRFPFYWLQYCCSYSIYRYLGILFAISLKKFILFLYVTR